MSVSTPVIEPELKTTVFKTRGHALSKDELAFCAETVRAGGVVVFPTDTVYGIGCNAFNPDAIARVYKIKGRSYTKPLPVLLADAGQLTLVAKEIHAETDLLIEKYWPGPLTLVFKTAPIALNATRGKQTIAVRVPDHKFVRDLLVSVHIPLAATSANASGKPPLVRGADVRKEFSGKVDVIIDGGDCPVGEASSVVDATHVPFTILREEAISKAELTRALKLG